MDNKFKIIYDDQLEGVVNKISSKLEQFGLAINELDGGDGYNEYEIIKLEKKESDNFMKISDAKITNSDRKTRVSGGLYITFSTNINLIKDSYLELKYKEETHYFKVSNISIKDNILEIDAVESGYWARKFESKENFDLRELIGLPIIHITDKIKIEKIHEMSCWC